MLLTDLISKQFRLTELEKKGLERLKLVTIRDILYYFPTRYSDIREVRLVRDAVVGEDVTLFGKLTNLKTRKGFKTKIPMAEATFTDPSGTMPIIWFNQAYLAKMFHEGSTVKLTGKVSEGKRGAYLSNPEVENEKSLPIDLHDSLFGEGRDAALIQYPVYPETRGVTSRWLYHAVSKIFKSGALVTLDEYIPEEILTRYKLPSLRTALIFIHTPKNKNDADAARKRFAFEEVFFIQLARAEERRNYEQNRSYVVKNDMKDIANFVDRFPFKHTAAQTAAITSILSDMAGEHPMARLLEGDVGSGKTAVAATASYAVIMNRPDGKSYGNLQVAYMAPTEILATQHFENFIQYFKHTGISVGLITGSGCRKFPTKVASAQEPWTTISRAQLLKWVANGEIPILIGTHALIQKSVKFKHLALVIIDEQHRFGTNQRKKLVTKEGFAPHLLSMTATPIPRTLALTIYGDLDLTLLDEMPAGRKSIITEVTPPNARKDVYEKISAELKAGRQLYVICPRIDEPDPDKELSLEMKNVTTEAKRLKKEVFPEYEIGILHSKMSKQKKEEVMEDFSNNAIQILCATSVVEVGVNVPNATIIIIEGAERFGLAQLHQLRGRVIRSTHQAYCYLFAEAKSQKTADRLKALKTAKNGFELSELDLGLRGAGELGGGKQWGITDLGMEAIKNIKMVEAARAEAQSLIAHDPELASHQKIKTILENKKYKIHFE